MLACFQTRPKASNKKRSRAMPKNNSRHQHCAGGSRAGTSRVIPQSAMLSEGSPAALANEGLLPRVQSHMGLEVVVPLELFPAEGASVGSQRGIHVGMVPHDIG